MCENMAFFNTPKCARRIARSGRSVKILKQEPGKRTGSYACQKESGVSARHTVNGVKAP